jgi:hypothetical protein
MDRLTRWNSSRFAPSSAIGSRLAALLVLIGFLSASPGAWSPQGHRLVALVAAKHLTRTAQDNVNALLDGATLADISVWADEYLQGNNQTSFWHYVNIPPDAASYDRDRDCPRQPGVAAGSRLDKWRDCVIDRIQYNQERLADRSLDRADRAIALKFLVHLIGDLHQPLHALGVERGGNGIQVNVFGSPTCGYDDGARYPCNLHSVWDTSLLAHRGWNDQRYLTELERQIAQQRWTTSAGGSPAEWAMESHALARAGLLPTGGSVDEAYYQKHIAVVERRLALGGLRLATVLNQSLRSAPAR